MTPLHSNAIMRIEYAITQTNWWKMTEALMYSILLLDAFDIFRLFEVGMIKNRLQIIKM